MTVDKKSACIFFSSPHSDGYTSKILNFCISNLCDEYKFEMVNCYKKLFLPCQDCGYCKKNEGCVFKDMEEIDKQLKTTDLLIFASPVYNFSFPAPLKIILDRMQRYFCSRFFMGINPPIFKQKKAILLLSCGSYDSYCIKIMEMQLKKIFTVINCKLIGTVVLYGTDKNDKNSLKNALKQIKKVSDDLKSNKI